ncbi:MAG: right-handed parallel beta-helix repeat-containing protein [Paludibacteraceae bacterium]
MLKIKLLITSLVFFAFLRAEDLTPLKPLLDAQRGNSMIDIPYGKYLMDIANGGGYTFSGLTDVTINMNGAEIICNKAGNVFTFSNCSNVTVKGFSIDFAPLLFTQGVITAVDGNKKWFEFVVNDGYPTTNIAATRTQFFDAATRELKRNSITTYEGSLTLSAVSGTTNKFRATKSYTWDAYETVGDLVVMSCTGNGHAFYMSKCENMVIENVILYGAASFAFFENETNNSHYLNCKVTLKKDETERPSTRLRSSNADGIHSKNARQGPTIENCEILYGGDDCIAINGAMYPVYAVDAANRTVSFLSTSSSSYFAANDSTQFVSYAGTRLGVAKVEVSRSVTPSSNDISTFLSKYSSLQNNTGYTYGIQIRVNEVPSNLAIGDVIYSLNKIGSGFVIKNNTVGHIRSRAILVKASDGIITGNTISDCEMGGIVVSPEYDWMEAGFSNNLEISHNTITNCMFGRSSVNGKAGALSVMCVGGDKSIAAAGAYNNISIHNNTVSDSPRPSIVVTSVNNLTYYSNIISPDLTTVRLHGYNFGVPNNVDVWTKNIIYKNNTNASTPSTEKGNIFFSNGQIQGLDNFIGGRFKLIGIDGTLIKTLPIRNDSIEINLSKWKNTICILSIEYGKTIYNQKIIIK